MKTIKALKALPGHAEGSIFDVDEDSAASLIERELAAAVDEAPEAAGGPFTIADARGSMTIVEVAGADYPEQPTPAEQPADDAAEEQSSPSNTEPPAEVPTEVTRSSIKADLVKYAVAHGFPNEQGGRDPVTEAQAEDLTKPELADKLGL